jgi:hypothetical protein
MLTVVSTRVQRSRVNDCNGQPAPTRLSIVVEAILVLLPNFCPVFLPLFVFILPRSAMFGGSDIQMAVRVELLYGVKSIHRHPNLRRAYDGPQSPRSTGVRFVQKESEGPILIFLASIMITTDGKTGAVGGVLATWTLSSNPSPRLGEFDNGAESPPVFAEFANVVDSGQTNPSWARPWAIAHAMNARATENVRLDRCFMMNTP